MGSRYYDPEVGRFINADEPAVIDGDAQYLSNNLYLYCFNNPVNMIDEDGNWPSWATKIIIGTAVIAAAAVLTVVTAETGSALACFAVGALKGSAIGAAVGAANGAALGAINHRISTGSWDGAGKAAIDGAADGYVTGAITGFISGGVNSKACFVAGTAVLTKDGLNNKLSSALRGEIKRDLNAINRGKRKIIRVPSAYEIAHRLGYSAKNGYSYKYAELNMRSLHRLQHRIMGYKY